MPHVRYSPFKTTIRILTAFSLLVVCACQPQEELHETSLQAELETGIEALRTFNYTEAYPILKKLRPHFQQDTEAWRQASYGLALAAWFRPPTGAANVEEARIIFTDLVEKAPGTNYAAGALLELGRIAETRDYLGDTPDIEGARDYYRKVQETFSGSEMEVRAILYEAQTYAQSLQPEKIQHAIRLLEGAVNEHRNSEWLGVVSKYIAQLYAFYLNDIENAVSPYLAATEYGLPRKSTGDIALWQLGNMAEAIGQPLTAAQTYTRIVEDYPRSIFGAIARDRVVSIAEANPEADIAVPVLSEVQLGR